MRSTVLWSLIFVMLAGTAVLGCGASQEEETVVAPPPQGPLGSQT